ncbi:hypothetical protein [Arcticibacter sp.]|uniref:hypothetical protein n=1 Tax=Arcticibacter sp. TaxID=1872630 RepID=UPI00388E4F36
MNSRHRIKPEIATQLGLTINSSGKYRLNPKQKERLDKLTNNGTQTNQYEKRSPVLSALNPDGSIMTIQEYCKVYGLDFDDVRSYKLISHTGVPFYNIASHTIEGDDELTIEEIRQAIAVDLAKYTYIPKKPLDNKKVDVVKLSDLHFGAYIDGLIKTKEFSISILVDYLNDAVRLINDRNSDIVHVHILGDLIESFTGMNHKNSWKGLQKGMIGAEVIKLCTQVLHTDFLSKINNLGEVKIIAGNHDRVTSDKNEDTDGGAADLISWGLKLIGYSVEFDPLVITHEVDGICHILMHGDKPISKKSTKDICWDYGRQGMFNLVCEGHLHSIIEKLSVAQRSSFKTVKDDAVDHRRMYCPSLFTGNSYSEHLGYTSNAGVVITRNNGKGIPNVHYYAL